MHRSSCNEPAINAEVLRGMERNSATSQALITRHLPKFLHGLGRDFAGTQGSRIYQALAAGKLSYRSYHFVKPAAGAAELEASRSAAAGDL